MSEAEVVELLTAPGGEFEVYDHLVREVPMRIYRRGPHTLREVFVQSARHGNADAMVYEGEVWSYSQLWDRAARLAVALHDRYSVGKGDRVGIAMRNYPEWIQTFWAGQLLGAVVVPLNSWLEGDELVPLIRHADPRVVVVDAERLARVVVRDLAGAQLVVARSEGTANVPSVTELTRGVDPDDLPPVELGPDDLATIVYTSGTTGSPKGAVATHLGHTVSMLNRQIRIVAKGMIAAAAGRPPAPARQETRLVTYPLFHVAGLTTACFCAFAGHRMLTMFKWDLARAVEMVERYHVAELSGAPLVVQEVTEAADRYRDQLRPLRVLGCGGASLPPTLAGDIDAAFGGGVSPRTGYGLTETTSGVIAISGAEFLAHPTSIGRPLPGVEVRVVAEDGSSVPIGQEGELQVRSPQVVIGYHNDPEATERSFREGWFATGDLVRVDADGRFQVVGRIKDVVIRGGENINCVEVEMAINSHPAVRESALVGLPHSRFGEEPAAVVTVVPGHRLDADEIRRHLSGRLAPFKVPVRMLFTEDSLPRTPSGKLLKRGLAACFAE
jgi:acyl-CoA synthetase (AMP-forming)/AMP-acid ligase II